ncbi:peptide chain release factor N(5)-glutamine methyltransferase [Achromobacter mucicolens]|uniref:peptide chain release factor N(5)-glutamine methyltransferase n=1 Tax=Achromobacter mucicolens TaxID=1389922 RepID=UPI0021D37C45|nr:peptide chain release factor N(5)-glutamine methyltransferase [Achromobacter mucicolens]MCU6615914.1 peptide chain release factor N(5)-glutamine methyltransferase [Achromobacter mucicolens]
MTAPQIKSLLLDTRLPRLEVRMLLEHVLDKPRAWLLAHDTDALAPEVAAAYEALALRRLAGEPMAYLLGHREFMGHRFRVTPDVLIPRPDTEVLVETALECIAGVTGPMVLDLGTGSGAIAVSIALARRDARVMASDVSAAALAVAAANAWELTAAVRFVEGSWYEAVPVGEGFDLIVSNPPYVASDDPHLDQGDLRFEPRGALTDGAGGLEDLARIVKGAGAHLKPGGSLWMEHGWDQAEQVRDMLRQAGFADVHSRQDLAGIERISGGRLLVAGV